MHVITLTTNATVELSAEDLLRLAQACGTVAINCFGCLPGIHPVPELRTGQSAPELGLLFEAMQAAFENAAVACGYALGSFSPPLPPDDAAPPLAWIRAGSVDHPPTAA